MAIWFGYIARLLQWGGRLGGLYLAQIVLPAFTESTRGGEDRQYNSIQRQRIPFLKFYGDMSLVLLLGNFNHRIHFDVEQRRQKGHLFWEKPVERETKKIRMIFHGYWRTLSPQSSFA